MTSELKNLTDNICLKETEMKFHVPRNLATVRYLKWTSFTEQSKRDKEPRFEVDPSPSSLNLTYQCENYEDIFPSSF